MIKEYTHKVSSLINVNVKKFLKQFGAERRQSADDEYFHCSAKNDEDKSRVFGLKYKR